LLVLAVVLAVGLACAPTAFGGRLLVSGHDFEFHCGSAQTKQCHFVRVALSYVRGGAPDPAKPVLVLDRGSLYGPAAINKAFGVGQVSMTTVDPRGAAFATVPIDTAHWSAIFVASDINCSGCDLNSAPTGANANTPDSTAIFTRAAAISAFYDAGGGIVTGAGATDSYAPTVFSPTNVNYYAFIGLQGEGQPLGPFALTPLGYRLGLTDGTNGTADDLLFTFCGGGCAHNSFGALPIGGHLKVAEADTGTGRSLTLIEDTDPPSTTILSGPPPTSTAKSATFTFKASEDLTTLECSLDDAAFAPCSTTQAFDVAVGHHTLDVRAKDLVGNVGHEAKTYAWDVEALDTTFGKIPKSKISSTKATFTFSSNDPAATFACKLDKQKQFTACTSPKKLKKLKKGKHTFQVQAIDATGTVDPTAAKDSFRVQ
jgi:hypothetical protein